MGPTSDATTGTSTSLTSTSPTTAADDTTDGSETTLGGETTQTSPTTTGNDTGTDTEIDACGPDERCVPDVPAGWSGPVVLADAGCPAAYPEAGLALNASLQPGVYTCGCNCGVQSVSCGLYLENEGIPFAPAQSCQSPPFDDECLSAVADATCSQTLTEVPATPSWSEEQTACGGATAGEACGEAGSCYAADAGGLCIAQDGEHACPAGFGEPSIYYQGFTDTRSCSACTCSPQGQACSISAEICSVGFEQITLQSGGSCYALNSGDGDGVSFLGSNVSNQGSCMAGAGAGQEQGDIAETGPVTVCCLE